MLVNKLRNGAKNPNAQYLLEMNRIFIQEEVGSWINYQIANAGGAGIWNGFSYPEDKCKRDIGYIVDRLKWDVGHGGNLKTRAAALSFVNGFSALGELSDSSEDKPYGGAGLAAETTQSVAAYGQMLTVINAVLNNTAPATLYQNVTDDSTAIVDQFTSATLVTETGVSTKITSLVGIITTTITAGDTSVIPARDVPQTLVKVSTGQHYEVLPIRVPAYCAILGDELRSTKIIAGPATTPAKDTYYTVKTFERVAEVVKGIVTGTTVAPTTGNTEPQSQEWPLAITAEATKVESLVDMMKYQIDYGLKSMEAAYTTDPITLSAADENAVANIKLNIAFLQAEVIAYLDTEYPTLKYGKTDSRRDTRFIIDSLIYDLTYGGNSMAVIAGLSYWDGDDETYAQLPATIKTQCIAAINYLKTSAQSVAQNVTIASPKQSTVIQALTGNVGSITEIANNVEDIVDIINNGPDAVGDSTTLVNPTLANNVNTTTALIAASDALVAAEDTVIQNVIDDLNAVAWHTDWAVDSGSLTTTQFRIYVGKTSLVHTYVSGGTVTKADGTVLTITNFVYDEATGYAIVTTSTHGLSATNIVNIKDITVSCNSGAGAETTVFPSATATDGVTAKAKYLQIKCIRDISKILEAVRFDFALNSNYRTLKAAHAYLRKTAVEVYTGKQKTITRDAIANALTTEAIANVAANTTAIARITASARIIDAVIFGATNEGSVCVTDDQNAYYAMLQLERNRTFIVEEVKNYVKYNFVEFDSNYTSATCERDVGLIVDSVSYDLITGSNFASSVAGAAYYRAVTSAQAVVGNQKMQTLAIIKYIRRLAKDYVQSAEYPAVYNAFTNVYEILDGGLTAVPTYTFPDNGTTASADSTTAATFIANRATYVSSVSTYLNTNYNAQWVALGAAGQAKCERDTGYIIDAITYDALYGGNYQTVIAGDSYFSYGTLQIGPGAEKTATLAAYADLKSTLSTAAETASQAGVEADMDNIIAIITNGAGTVATTYPIATGETASIQTSFTGLQADKSTLQTSTTTYITNTFSSYTYNETLCLRDVGYYIDALKYDLMWPGNYASKYVARFYNNSVTGSQEEDMFYLRDATGVRNSTLQGLSGDLLPENASGYSKVSAGAYCSLDPGWGPDDFRTWIITRSPYIQGITTFGNAATGQKIDGALHNGGNDSMVSNDFTQVISDGIGAHILNNGRAELVSVFTYYSHVGYLAETGGRIRAANGNNSYGDFGSIATGVDPDETPVTAVVDNRTQYNATIGQINVDNVQLLNVEFNHAGNDYTEATLNIFGPGDDEVLVADEFRDGAFNYAYIDQNADADIPLGGSGYILASNVAQSGSTTGLFLSATDGALSSAYIGMKVYIIGAAGIGQYAIIATYNAGTKEATVTRESDGVAGWDHVVPGTAIVAPNSSSTYQIEPRVTITAPTNSVSNITMPTSTTWYDTEYVRTAAQYTGVSQTGGTGTGATFDVTRNGGKYYLTANAAGTDYTRLDQLTIVGTAVGGATTANDITITVTSVNSVTGAIVDFDFAGTAEKGKFLAVGAGTNGAVSIDGNTWTAEVLPALGSGNWASIADGLQDDGSSTFQPSAVVVIADGAGTVAYSADADTWQTSSLPGAFNAAGENTVAFGQITSTVARFVVISDADRDVAYTDNGGATWSITSTALPATGYGEMVYGAGKFVAINSGTTSAAYSADGVTWTGVTAPAAFAAVTDIVWGNGKFVAIGGTNGVMYSLDGITWVDNALATIGGAGTEQKIAYGQGMFVITSDNTVQVYTSTDGLYWTVFAINGGGAISGGTKAIAFGNPANEGKFVMMQPGAGTAGRVAKINTPAKGRASVANEQVFAIRIIEPGSGYTSAPTITITDPNNIYDVDLVPQIGNGVLANPTFVNRGTGFTSSTGEIDATTSNGNADFPQAGNFIAVRRLTSRPVVGSNVEFASLPGEFYKLVNVVSFLGTNDGSYTGFLQVSPSITVDDNLPDGDAVELRIRFSQVRLTGHDFLDIGTGGFADTNYPGTPLTPPSQVKETSDFSGGRVFYTATDQDGNFRVGDLFTIEQSTGVATLNADAFNIAGLQELSLGEVTLGGNSASVTEFSTDPFFTANSDNVVPTQRAVKAYIESQIGGGGATLNVNSVTAGDIFVGGDTITTLSGNSININANVVFNGTVLGLPLAYNYFLR